MSWPSVAKLASVLALMLLLVRLKLSIGWALCLGAVLCGLWFGQDAVGIAMSVRATVTEPRYIILISIIMLVLILNHSLQQSGQIERIVDAFFRVSRRPRTTLVFFPALLGLLPMPGGALFSAPMVEATGKRLGIDDRDKTLINYWFRHIWEYSWPLYPGIILMGPLLGYDVGVIAVVQFPMVLAVIGIGYLFFVRGLKPVDNSSGPAAPMPKGRAALRFLGEIAPIWLVIVLYAVLKVGIWKSGIAALERLPNNLELVAAICIAIAYTWVSNRMGLRGVGRVFWHKDMLDHLVIALGIVVFAGVLLGSGAARSVARDLQGAGIPVWLVAMTLPAVVGAVTGITMNMVILTFPIMLLMVHNEGLDHLTLAYGLLAFACGYSAILITPVHICMVQSNHFFRLGATATLRHLVLPVLCVVAAGVVMFLAWVHVFPHIGLGPGTHTIPSATIAEGQKALSE